MRRAKNKTRKTVDKEIETLFSEYLDDYTENEPTPPTEKQFNYWMYGQLNKVEKKKLEKKLKQIGYERIDSIVEIFMEKLDIISEEKWTEDLNNRKAGY